MALAKNEGLLQQLECRRPQLPLIEEFGLIGAPEAGHPQLALGKVRKETLSKEDDSGSKEDASSAYTQSIQDTSEVSADWLHKPPCSPRSLYNPKHLFTVYVLKARAFGFLVFPTASTMRAFEKESLVLVLCHLSRRTPDTLIGLALKGERNGVRRSPDRQKDDVPAWGYADPFDLDPCRRLKPVHGLGYLAQSFVGYLLPNECPIGPDTESNLASIAV